MSDKDYEKYWTKLVDGYDLPILYKLDSKGRKRQWSITVLENDNETFTLIMKHGLVGGKLKPTLKPVLSGKNIGKKSQTSIKEQALLEAFSRFKSKLRDMTPNISDPTSTNVYPMLVKNYHEIPVKRRIKAPCKIQPKLDGHRCISHWDPDKKTVIMYSRLRHEIVNLPEISAELYDIFSSMGLNPDFWLDGELYKHGMYRQEISSIVRKTVNIYNPKNKKERDKLEYWVYDCFYVTDKKGRKQPFIERDRLLEKKIGKKYKKIVKVPTFNVEKDNEIPMFHKIFMEHKYEGSILRTIKGKYTFGRSSGTGRSYDIQKYKTRKIAEGYIIAIEPNPEQKNMFNFVIKETKNNTGKIFKLPSSTGSEEYRASVLASKEAYVNEYIRYKYAGLTKDGLPTEATPILENGQYIIVKKH
jgi:ATP-dependent DNA ligase